MTGDRPYFGMLLMVGFCFIAPFTDGLVKIVAERLPLAPILLARILPQVAILVPLAWLTQRSFAMSGRSARIVLLRALMHLTAMGFMYTSLVYMPLADVVAIVFINPFLVLMLGAVFLGEHVGWRRFLACCAGFFGALLVIQPNFAEVGPAAFLPLVTASSFAVFVLLTRVVAQDVDAVPLQGITGLINLSVLSAVLLLPAAAGAPLVPFAVPGLGDFVLLTVVGLLGVLIHLMLVYALRAAPSATLAPIQYLQIPFAAFFGWLLFQDLPDGLAAVGIIITVGSGLYILHRESQLARARANGSDAAGKQPHAPH